jgi:hypothetical protein
MISVLSYVYAEMSLSGWGEGEREREMKFIPDFCS